MRLCTVCHKVITEGYLIEDDAIRYCSDECLNSDCTPEEIARLQADDENLQLYWTNWCYDDVHEDDLIKALMNELEDAISFMELFEEEDTKERLQSKVELWKIATEYMSK